MGISSFLAALFTDGRTRVDKAVIVPDEELRRLDDLLTALERQYRDDLPAAPPEVRLPAARAGAVLLYRVCQFLVYRDLGVEAIERELREGLDVPLSPSIHYSVDLALRFLPDAARLAAGRASGDPLLAAVLRLANQWPLSSVGLPGVGEVHVDTFIEDPCLRRLYADRIIARRDWTRTGDNRVQAEVTAALGAFPELAPDFGRAVGASEGGPCVSPEPVS
jgi:hypothetical protein